MIDVENDFLMDDKITIDENSSSLGLSKGTNFPAYVLAFEDGLDFYSLDTD